MQVSDRIGRGIKLHDLHVLMAVVQAGSMRKATALLNTTQSAISRTIADLEQTIGARLLDRSPQGIEPTRYGQALLRRGVAVFDELKQGMRDIEFLSDPQSGELLIGSGTVLAEGFVLTVIERLSRDYPRVVYQLIPNSQPDVYDGLRARRFECLTWALKPDRQEDVSTEVLFEEQLAVVAGVDSPWVRRRKIGLADLVNEPWTWPPPGGPIHSLVVEAFRANGLKPPRPTILTEVINVRTRLAATRGFLTVLYASTLTFPAKHAWLRPLAVELPNSTRPVGISWLKNRTLSPLAQLFIECAREVAKPLAKRKS
jgi:DNA-binding transcriptional LysR family regulator